MILKTLKKLLQFIIIICLSLEGWAALFMQDFVIIIFREIEGPLFGSVIIIPMIGIGPKIVSCLISWLLAYGVTLELTGDVLRHE